MNTPRVYASKVKNAQEAHEAIRPAGDELPHPRSRLKRQTECWTNSASTILIWKRTVASQMADARKRRITISIEGDRSRLSSQRHDDRF